MNERVRFIGSLSHYLAAATTFRSLINGYTCLFIWRKTNIGFPNGPVFGYGNFFIPRVEKSSQISPRAKNFVLPRAVGPREARFFSQGLIFEDFSTLGMKKFPYLKTGPFGNPIFVHTYLTYLTYLRSIDRIECSYWSQTNRCHYFELSIGIAQPFLQVIRKRGLPEDDSLLQAQVIDCQHLQM